MGKRKQGLSFELCVDACMMHEAEHEVRAAALFLTRQQRREEQKEQVQLTKKIPKLRTKRLIRTFTR